MQKPRLRRKGAGEGAEVAVPAYVAMQSDERLREKLLSILIRGVSTRSYREVVPEMASRRFVVGATRRVAPTSGCKGRWRRR